MEVSQVRGAGARFVVDRAHLGNSESAWGASAALKAVTPLAIPPVARIVVVAPHPDDEILGAAGLLQVAGAERASVEVWAVTDGEASHPGVAPAQLRRVRDAESHVALSRLDLPGRVQRVRLGFADGHVSRHETELADRLSATLGPDTLCVAPWRADGHPDHDASGRAAAMAARASGAPLVEYLVWAWHWADPLLSAGAAGEDVPWLSCGRLNLNRRQTARKRWATMAFRSQIRAIGADPNFLPILPHPVLRRFWRPFEVYVA